MCVLGRPFGDPRNYFRGKPLGAIWVVQGPGMIVPREGSYILGSSLVVLGLSGLFRGCVGPGGAVQGPDRVIRGAAELFR